MVTGKRDLLSDKARELIREAGIFHIITISGVQMTLVAGMISGREAVARVLDRARVALPDQEMGGGGRHGSAPSPMTSRPARASAPSGPCS